MRSLLSFIRGIGALLIIVANVIFWCVPLVLFAFLKFIVPVAPIRNLCTSVINTIAFLWAAVNNFCIRLYLPVKWDVTLPAGLERNKNYLVISNHSSWIDVVALQMVFNSTIPFFRFFLKSVLIWVPVLGLAWWALDYPFMKRYSKEYLLKHPEHKGRDLDSTRMACEKYARTPVSIMNFPEGTRFTPAKHAKQNSPYTNLLKPKAGGVGYVLSAMGGSIDSILNVTLVYPASQPKLWHFLQGKITRITIHVEKIPVTKELLGDYTGDEKYRTEFQRRFNELWKGKDELIEKLRGGTDAQSSD